MPRFQHPSVFSEEHRAITYLDVIAAKCPLFDVIADFRRLPDHKAASGWSGLTVIDGKLHRLRGGGTRGGPRSVTLASATDPGVYARNEETGRIVELLAKKEAAKPAPLSLIDIIPFGWLDPENWIAGWDGWGDEQAPAALAPDPMDTP